HHGSAVLSATLDPDPKRDPPAASIAAESSMHIAVLRLHIIAHLHRETSTPDIVPPPGALRWLPAGYTLAFQSLVRCARTLLWCFAHRTCHEVLHPTTASAAGPGACAGGSGSTGNP